MLDLPGLRLHLEEQGQGPSLVLVHGFGGSLHSWDRLAPLLVPGRHVLRFDLRDFGESRADSAAAFTHASDLAALLEARSIARCDLAGVSLGGGVALGFALDHPDKVRRLVLISPQISGWEWSAPWRAAWARITRAAHAGRMDEARLLWAAHPLFAAMPAVATAALNDEIGRFAGRQWVRDNHAEVLPDIERLHTLRVPTLLLTGERDMAEFRLMADIIAASSEHVRRADIPGAGHMLHLERPEECARHIEAFLKDQPAAGLD